MVLNNFMNSNTLPPTSLVRRGRSKTIFISEAKLGNLGRREVYESFRLLRIVPEDVLKEEDFHPYVFTPVSSDICVSSPLPERSPSVEGRVVNDREISFVPFDSKGVPPGRPPLPSPNLKSFCSRPCRSRRSSPTHRRPRHRPS